MIVILEGLNGTGKTSVAKALAADRGYKIYRPLREGVSSHWDDSGLKRQLTDCRVQSNSYLDDVFAVDALVQMESREWSVVLDRSMPSAVAYGLLNGTVKGEAHRNALLTYWKRRLLQLQTPVLYFWLQSEHDVARSRTAGRYPSNEHLGSLFSSFEACYEYVLQSSSIRCFKINTTRAHAYPRVLTELARNGA